MKLQTTVDAPDGGIPDGQVVGQSYGGCKASGIGRELPVEGAVEGFTQTEQINVELGR